MRELKPCPFCGGEAQLMHMDLDSIDEGWKVWGVFCIDDLNDEDYKSHGHFVDNYANKDEAIEAWNTRAGLGDGTCTVVSTRYIESDMPDSWYEHDLSCGHTAKSMQVPPKFCEECGKRIDTQGVSYV